MTEKIYIPFIWEVKQHLTDSEYLVFALCHSLSERGKTIYFSNEYIGKLLNKSKRRIQQIINSLENKGFILRIVTGTKRIIEILTEKINTILGRNKLHPPTKDTAPKPTKDIAPNNIVINNKKDECKFSHDFVKNYFISLIGKNEKNMDIELMTKKFINKHLSEGSPSKNKKIWKGLARNWLLSWESNTKTDNNETSKQTPYTALLKLAKQAKTITINNNVLKVVNGKFTSAINSKEYNVYDSLLNWYDRGEGDIKIDGEEVKI